MGLFSSLLFSSRLVSSLLFSSLLFSSPYPSPPQLPSCPCLPFCPCHPFCPCCPFCPPCPSRPWPRRRLRVRLEAQLGHVEVLVERDEARRGKGEAEEVAEREPVPVLGEDEHADDGEHVGVSRARLQRDRRVATATVDNALCEDGA